MEKTRTLESKVLYSISLGENRETDMIGGGKRDSSTLTLPTRSLGHLSNHIRSDLVLDGTRNYRFGALFRSEDRDFVERDGERRLFSCDGDTQSPKIYKRTICFQEKNRRQNSM